MDFIDNTICYFCEHSANSIFMSNYNEFHLCEVYCDSIVNFDSQQINECPVCYESKKLFKLNTCSHSICLQCCKTIYFGTSTFQRPKSSNEIIYELLLDFPYEENDDDENDPARIKWNEYEMFKDTHFNRFIEEKTYDELITIRNNLISERPEWMNAEEFINYENGMFRFHKECQIADKEWEQYNDTKTKGNRMCPLCRTPP